MNYKINYKVVKLSVCHLLKSLKMVQWNLNIQKRFVRIKTKIFKT